MAASVKQGIRVVVFVGAVLVALLFAEKQAHADDATAQPASPAPDAGGSAPPTGAITPPLPGGTTDVPTPPTPDPGPPISVPPVVVPGGSIDLPTPPAPTRPPSGGDIPSVPPVDPHGETANQSTDVVTGGTSVANTGGNTAGAGVHSIPGEIALPGGVTGGTATGTVTTGNAHGRGSVDQNGIQQSVNATVTENGKVVVVQVAIIVNIGIGIAGSGNNAAVQTAIVSPSVSLAMVLARSEVAGAGPGGGTGPTPAQITSGNANATGTTGSTKVTQSLVLTGRDVSTQLASVLNLGVGVANSGLNFALAAVSSNNAGGPSSATFVTLGGGSSITAGAANALGNHSSSAIFQVVTVSASGNGNLLVIQRAVIVNFGLALANSGFNTAGGAAINASLPGAGDAQALLMLLLGQGSGSGPALLGASGGPSSIGTGAARAVGNNTETGIRQRITGSVTGDDTARAIQDAWVGNFGVGVANSGGNGAGGLSGLDASSVAAARDALGAFLAGLTGVGDPVQGLDASFQLGNNLLQLQGNVSGTETLLGVVEPGSDTGPDDPSLVVRQVTAVLNIGIAVGDSGHNTALVTTNGAHTTTAGRGSTVASASIITGDAKAVGSHFAVAVCQAIGDTVTCAEKPPKPTPEPPGPTPQPTPPPDTVVPGVLEEPPGTPPTIRRVPVVAATLPFTGSPIGAELAAGSGLLIAGMLMARRRRTGATR